MAIASRQKPRTSRKRGVTLVISISASACLAWRVLLLHGDANPAAQGTYTGVVLDAESKLPLERLRVTTDDSDVHSTITDSQGRFALSGPAGRKVIFSIWQASTIVATNAATLDAHRTTTDYSYARVATAAVLQSVKPDTSPRPRKARVDAASAAGNVPRQVLAVASSIKGYVQDAANRAPLAGATVRIAGTTIETTTNNSGQYIVVDLAPGTKVRLSFTHPLYEGTERIVEPQAEELPPVPLQPRP